MRTEIDGISVNYAEYGGGNGAVIVILQGWGTNLSLYKDLAEHLAAYARVLVPELPGFGETAEPPHAFSADDYADFTEHFLTALGVSRCSLIGHSNGGRVIMKLVTRENSPFTFERLVFLDSAGVVHEKTAKQKAKALPYKLGKAVLSLGPVKAAFPDALDDLKSRHGSADYRAASPRMRETLVKLVNEDFRPLMPRIRQPSLLIWGTADTATPLADARVFEELIPNAGLVEVAGAGHYSYLEQPAFVYRVLDSFLKK